LNVPRTPLPPGQRLCYYLQPRPRRRHRDQVGNHTLRATGITPYLKNGGSLENAAAMASRVSARMTQLYDRRREESRSADSI
jgi:hypothetical protein